MSTEKRRDAVLASCYPEHAHRLKHLDTTEDYTAHKRRLREPGPDVPQSRQEQTTRR